MLHLECTELCDGDCDPEEDDVVCRDCGRHCSFEKDSEGFHLEDDKDDDCDCLGVGWVHTHHSDSRPFPHIERCDACQAYRSDDAARRAHRKTCTVRRCPFGKSRYDK